MSIRVVAIVLLPAVLATSAEQRQATDVVCFPMADTAPWQEVQARSGVVRSGRYKGMIDYNATSRPTSVGAVPYSVHYALIVGKEGEQVGPDSILKPREGLAGIGLAKPTSANWYSLAAVDVSVNGRSMGEVRGKMWQRRMANREEVQMRWAAPEGKTTLTFAVCDGDDHLRVRGEVEPTTEIYSLDVTLRCFPGGFRQPRDRRVSTAKRELKAGQRFALQLDEFWIHYWDAVLDYAKDPKRSQGSCALMSLPEEAPIVRVNVGEYAVTTTLSYPPRTRRFQLALWELPRLSVAQARARLEEVTEGIEPALGRSPSAPVPHEGVAPGEIVAAGRPRATLVVPSEPREREVAAAREIQDYVTRMSGAVLPLVRDSADVPGNRLLIGRTRFTDRADTRIDRGRLGDEGFVVKTVGRDLVVCGGSDFGTQYAACALLEHLGIGWFVDAPMGEVVPRRRDIRTEALDICGKPDFPMRWVGRGRWAVRNRCNRTNGAYRIESGIYHTQDRLMPIEKLHGPHPEYYAITQRHRGSEKGRVKLCTANVEVARLVAREMAQIAVSDPNIRLVSLPPSDGTMYCDCPHCQALDEIGVPRDQRMSRRLMLFYNTVAEELERLRPGMRMLVGAYHIYTRPPRDESIRAHPSISVIICHYNAYCLAHPVNDPSCQQNQAYRELIRRWQEIGCKVFFYEYYVKGEWLSMLWPITRSIGADIPHFKSIDVEGVYTQYSPAQAWTLGLQYYVAARLLWDCDQNVGELIDAYCNGLFGKAGPVMRELYDTLDRAMANCGRCIGAAGWANGPAVFTPELCDKLAGLLARAEAAADSDLVRQRLKKVEASLYFTTQLNNFLRMQQAAHQNPDIAARADAFGEAADFLERLVAEARTDRKRFGHAVSPVMLYMTRFIERCRQYAQTHRVASLPRLGSLPKQWRFSLDPQQKGADERWFAPDYDDSDWRRIEIRKTWESQGYDYDGFAWYRVRFDLPVAQLKRPPSFLFEAVDGEAWVYLNGRHLVHHKGWDEPFVAKPPANVLNATGNVLAVRVWDGSGNGGIWKDVYVVEDVSRAPNQ